MIFVIVPPCFLGDTHVRLIKVDEPFIAERCRSGGLHKQRDAVPCEEAEHEQSTEYKYRSNTTPAEYFAAVARHEVQRGSVDVSKDGRHRDTP